MSLPAVRCDRGTVHLTQYEAKDIVMETRTLTKPDYISNRKYKVPRKVISLSLGDLHQTYLPAQPVLSSRTVDIDLPGTRTYRQKSTLDILEEQQRLIRQLYLKPRAPVSAPPRSRTPQTTRSLPESNIGKVNIEVKGRPLTSGPSASSTYKENSPVIAPRRPKTASPLKHVCPLTNCHRAVTEDRDLLAISQSNQKLSNKIHSYWKSDVNTLAVGKFVKGQKFLDEALPNLDSWLTFGGAADIDSQGVIDAFARFNNSEDYYNIKGSVGSQVARQLQKGGKIRIGINGTLQTQGLKVKKRNNNNMTKLEGTGMLRDSQHNTTNKEKDESLLAVTASTINSEVKGFDATDERVLPDEETEAAELVASVQPDRRPSELDFGELVISELDDFQERPAGAEMQKPSTPECVEMSVDTASEASMPNEEVVNESLRLATPLSWTDQCSKANVKIIHANLCHREITKQVMSETFPVKFHKLTDGVIRPKLMEVKSEGFKMKQRSANESKNNRDNVSKVKVVYIDPLTTEEDDMVKGLSVDAIINHKLEGCSSVNSSLLIAHGMGDQKNTSTNTERNKAKLPHRESFTQSELRRHLSTSSNSVHGDHGSLYSPKLKVTPVHSAAGHKVGNLRIMSAGAGATSKGKDLPRNGRTPRKLTPARPLHLTIAGQGSSIKAGSLKGETEYITIISQLKIPSPPAVSQGDHVAISNVEQLSAGRNSPADLNQITIGNEAQAESEPHEGDTEGLDATHISHTSSSKSVPVPTDDRNDNGCDLEDKDKNSDVEFPAAATPPATPPSGRPIATASATSPANFPVLTAAASLPAMKPIITETVTPPSTALTTTVAATSLATFPSSAAISIPTAEEESSSHLLPQHEASDTSPDQPH